jgi:hypothetical protein
MAKNIIFWCGITVIVMGFLGMFNIGHFVLYYGPDKLICVKE